MKKLLLATVLALGLPSIAYGQNKDRHFFLGKCVNNSHIISDGDIFHFKCENLTIEKGIGNNSILQYKTYDKTISFTVDSIREINVQGKNVIGGYVTKFQINSKTFQTEPKKSLCLIQDDFSTCIGTSEDKKNPTQAAIFFEVNQ